MNATKSRAKDIPLPSPFGPHDQIRMLNHITAQKMARDHISEFMCVVTHAKVRGATSAWVAPLALI